jgi:hypothetical protein
MFRLVHFLVEDLMVFRRVTSWMGWTEYEGPGFFFNISGYFNFSLILRSLALLHMVAPLHGNGATLLQISLEVIQYPIAPEGIQYSLANDNMLLATLWQQLQKVFNTHWHIAIRYWQPPGNV